MSNTTHWPRLLPCPFCGGRARAHPKDAGYWRVSCDNALTCGHSGSSLPTLQTAAESWNRRVAVAPGEVAEAPIYWRCFHCDFIARDKASALEHFGPGISERPAICAQPVNVAAVATIKRDDEGQPQISWLLEGGPHEAAPDFGEAVLLIADAAITDDCGHGEVYRVATA